MVVCLTLEVVISYQAECLQVSTGAIVLLNPY